MTTLVLAYDLANYTPANANPPQSNFQRIVQHTNQELINRDGSVAMTGQLKLVGDPENALDATTKQYVDLILPVGVILPFGGTAVPGGGIWALANGAVLASADYPELFSRYQQTYSPAGTAGGNFHLPNLADRVPVGQSPTKPLGSTNLLSQKDAQVVEHFHSANHGHTASSTIVSTDHVHGLNNHTHGGTTNPAGYHTHGWGDGQYQFAFYQPNAWQTVPGGGGTNLALSTFTAAPDHTHGFGTGGPTPDHTAWQSSGVAGWGGPNYQHSHPITVDANNFNTGPAGQSGTDKNLPPYVAINWIVRVK